MAMFSWSIVFTMVLLWVMIQGDEPNCCCCARCCDTKESSRKENEEKKMPDNYRTDENPGTHDQNRFRQGDEPNCCCCDKKNEKEKKPVNHFDRFRLPTPSERACDDGYVIDKQWFCDGEVECYDGSDEGDRCYKICQDDPMPWCAAKYLSPKIGPSPEKEKNDEL